MTEVVTGRVARSGSAGRRPGWSWRVAVSIRRAYGLMKRSTRRPVSPVVLVGAAAVAGVVTGTRSWPLAVSSVVFGAVVAGWRGERRTRVVLLLVAVAIIAGWRAQDAVDAVQPDRLGPYSGWVRLVDDPQPYGGGTRLVLEVEGERYEAWVRGRARRIRVAQWRGGERVVVAGVRVSLSDERAGRVRWQHVVGEFEIDWAADRIGGGPVDRASNRVRVLIERGATVLPGDDGALFRGLVVGDDRDQPREMLERFRASGLSHLTAVSGQNVAFVLAAAGPLLRRMRPWWRWGVTLALIGWFVSLTRFEPSIVRAGTMAALSATGFVLGRERSPERLLWSAVTLLLLVDPLLVESVGFWLSVGATAGVVSVAPWLSARLGALGRLAEPVSVTLGAQVGVAVPALLVFGRLPLVSVPANLLAVPVAGFVMLYGLPAGLLAGAVPAVGPVVMFPCRVGVRWVDSVAVAGERIEPSGGLVWVGWVVLVVATTTIAAMNRGRHGSPPADR